jgi:hypothetical protein
MVIFRFLVTIIITPGAWYIKYCWPIYFTMLVILFLFSMLLCINFQRCLRV